MIARYYTTCTELPLWNFIRIVVHGELKRLLKSELCFYSKEKLQVIWEDIFAEYATLSGDTKNKATLGILKEITVLRNKVNIIQSILTALTIVHVPELVAELRNMGFRFKFDPENKESYLVDINRTVTQAKGLIVRIKQREAELEQLKGKDDITQADYDTILAELSHYQGYRLDPKEITVSEFIAILTRFKKTHG